MKRTNHNRRYTGSSKNRPDNKKFRQAEAKERQAAYDNLSNAEKIAMLDRKLGVGVGAKKQRARLEAGLHVRATGALIPEGK